jgi:hypothetical protein
MDHLISLTPKRKPLRQGRGFAIEPDYFVGGGVAGACCGVVAGVAGALCFWPLKTELPDFRDDMIESDSDVSMKTITATVVARESADAAPRGPNVLWLPVPPNAPAKSALLPLCSRTTMIKKIQTIT